MFNYKQLADDDCLNYSIKRIWQPKNFLFQIPKFLKISCYLLQTIQALYQCETIKEFGNQRSSLFQIPKKNSDLLLSIAINSSFTLHVKLVVTPHISLNIFLNPQITSNLSVYTMKIAIHGKRKISRHTRISNKFFVVN